MRRLFGLLGALGALLIGFPVGTAQAVLPPTLPQAAKFWLTDPGGNVWSFGGATFHGSLGGVPLARPIVATATTSTSGGYWMVASDGGVFTFGDAAYFGSTGALHLNQPIVGMAPTPTGDGYWLVASDGGIFSFGDATFYGSTGAIKLNQPVVSATAARDGKGYWLTARDGGVFNFGSAGFFGSDASASPQSALRVVRSKTGNGYWVVRENGEVSAFGDAAGTPPAQSVLWTPSTAGDQAVTYAFTQLGKPYIWGGNGPVGYDCSGLVLASWKRVGRTFARVANDQYRTVGVPVAMTDLEPGDLVFWGDNLDDWASVYHTAMYVGGGNIVESTGDHVQLNSLRQWGASDVMPVGRRP